MDLRIALNHSEVIFTNGESVCGSVVLYCPCEVSLSKISVALTGEAVVSLKGNTGGAFLRRNNRETQRIFQDTLDLWPSPYTLDDKASKHKPLRLAFGYHKFPFRLQIPWFTASETEESRPATPIARAFNRGGMKVSNEYSSPSLSSSRELPPSLEYSDGISVAYSVDAVVVQSSIFKDTLRKSETIAIYPIDTRSLPTNPSEPYPCMSKVQATIVGPRTVGAETRLSSSKEDLILLSKVAESANINITAALPTENSLTCNSPISMRLSVQKVNAFTSDLYLQSFQAMLVGYTEIGLKHTSGAVNPRATTTFTVQSLSNLSIKVLSGDDPIGFLAVLDEGLWTEKALPNDVVPSFDFSSISRRYELDLLMGFQYASTKARLMFIQLRIPITIHSGIRPGRLLSLPPLLSSAPPSPSLAEYESVVHNLINAPISKHTHTDPTHTEPSYNTGISYNHESREAGTDDVAMAPGSGPRVRNGAGIEGWLNRFERSGLLESRSRWSQESDVHESPPPSYSAPPEYTEAAGVGFEKEVQ